MDALSSFLADPWATIAAYWQAVPSHVRIIISFLITRTVSGIIRRAVAPRADAGPARRGAVVEVTDAEAFKTKLEEAKKAKRLTVVDFTASWCGPCKRVAPQYAAMSLKYGDVAFLKVDVDKASDVAKGAAVRCMPTFQFFKDGEKVDAMEGADAGKIESILLALGAAERRIPDPDEDGAEKDADAKKTE